MIEIEFSRVGKHTIKCEISEEEITDLGFSVEEIITNGVRTQEFMNRIFDLAEQEFETKFEMGIKTVQVEFRADHVMSLTFSEYPNAGGMMEHLKDIVNGLLNSIPQQKWEEIQKQKETAPNQKNHANEEQQETRIMVMLKFQNLETIIRFSAQVNIDPMPENILCKYQDVYYLMMDLSGCTEQQVRKLSLVTDEYAQSIEVGAERWAFLREHGSMILSSEAIQQLSCLSSRKE